MERAISPEERVRRAEEIYYRRRIQGLRVSSSSVNTGSNNKISIGKKIIIQIIICSLIYSFFYVLNINKNVFGDSVIIQTKSILSYDINFFKLYNQGKEYFEGQYNNILKKNNQNQENNTQTSDELNDNETHELVNNDNQNEKENLEENDSQDDINTDTADNQEIR